MQVQKLIIRNLRSVKKLTVSFDEVTALLGGNNAGKSTVLHAIDIFFEAAPQISLDDYHNREEDDIEITLVFHRLVPEEVSVFGSAVVGDRLTIRRVFSKHGEKQPPYEALALAFPPFSTVRQAAGKTDKRTSYNNLVGEIDGLERVASADAADAAMNEWEAANPDLLELEFRRDFFGATNVASGKLKKKTALQLVPAVADAHQETSDAKKSPIISLLSQISKQMYENKRDVTEFFGAVPQAFRRLGEPRKRTGVKRVE
ncbi:AAA family ATPase [Loktanella sp. Alg231-35]|uniref:AAA family ATPase n=1 Tax=Loktanella sp. Alg231-35 TaxID=1922220 RepID=UPI000D557BC2|nr:AAA family ATPase [Loktanella sp. Alg231-35]